MLGYTIIMCYVAIILGIVGIRLRRGNTTAIHSKDLEKVKDKTAYAKSMGKALLVMSVATFLSGFLTLVNDIFIFISDDTIMIIAVGVLLIGYLIGAIMLYRCFKTFRSV